MKYGWLCLVMLCAVTAACAAERQAWNQGDTRLERKISIEANHAKLVDVLKTLTDQTGIALTAGSSKRDWRVRERHVTIRAKEMPLGTLMAGLSQLLGYRIARGGKDGQWSYMIWQDKKSKDLEEAMIEADKDAEKAAIRKAQLDAIDMAKRALAMSPEAAMKKADSDPWLAYLGGTKSGRGLARIFSTYGNRCLHSIEEFRANPELTGVSFSEMPSALRTAVTDAISGHTTLARRMQSGRGADFVPQGVRFMPMLPSGFGGLQTGGLGGMMWIDGSFGGGQGDALLFPFASSNSVTAAKWGREALSLKSGASPDDSHAKGEAEGDKISCVTKTAQDSPTERNPPKDPKLTREVVLGELPAPRVKHGEIAYAAGDGERVLSEIFSATGLTLELESFDHSAPIGLFMKSGKQPLYMILVGLEKAGYSWSADDGMLRVRPVDWATRRSYEVSQDLISYYKAMLDTQGEFTVDDIAALVSSLTDVQLDRTIRTDPDLSCAITGHSLPRQFLEFYNSLKPNQRASLANDAGLGFGQLTPVQWDRLNEVVGRSGDEGYIIDGAIQLAQEPRKSPFEDLSARKVSFDIAMQIEGQDKPRYRRVTVMFVEKEYIAKRRAELRKEREAEGKVPVHEVSSRSSAGGTQ